MSALSIDPGRPPWTRRATAVVLVAWMLLSPAANQVFDLGTVWVRPWVMYRSVGIGQCDVRYAQRLPEGRTRWLDRYALLDREPPHLQDDGFRWLPTREVVVEVGRELCDVIGEEADVRVHARCGTEDGWRPVASGEDNVCEASL